MYYGYALVDGYKEKVGGYLIEAPTLFKGRGDHPKAGLIKARILPEDITINIA
jgi:DNA topoisomerase-1